MLFVLEEAKETILDITQGTVRKLQLSPSKINFSLIYINVK